MRAEVRAFLVNRPPIDEAEYLIAAAIRQDRTRPADKPVQTTAARDQIVAGPQIQVIRVAQQDLRTEAFEIPVRDTLDGALGADRHEGRRLDRAVRCRKHTGPGDPVGVHDLKGKRHMLSLVVGLIA